MPPWNNCTFSTNIPFVTWNKHENEFFSHALNDRTIDPIFYVFFVLNHRKEFFTFFSTTLKQNVKYSKLCDSRDIGTKITHKYYGKMCFVWGFDGLPSCWLLTENPLTPKVANGHPHPNTIQAILRLSMIFDIAIYHPMHLVIFLALSVISPVGSFYISTQTF